MMSTNLYKAIVWTINKSKLSDVECFELLISKYPDLSEETLGSIMNNCRTLSTRNNHTKCQEASYALYTRLLQMSLKKNSSGNMLKLAVQYGVQPLTIAKLVLTEHIKHLPDGDLSLVPEMLKDTSLIDHPVIAHEVFLCSITDFSYSTLGNLIKKRIGYEYELKLQKTLRSHGLTFMNEIDMRNLCFPKTPDILLDIPIAINNSIVKWIESKALFANDQTHQQFLQDQFSMYFNSFGPGLVIYWFGYVETIVSPDEKRFIISNEFPETFIQL